MAENTYTSESGKLFYAVYEDNGTQDLKSVLKDSKSLHKSFYVRNVDGNSISFEKIDLSYNIDIICAKWDSIRGEQDKKVYVLNTDRDFVFISYDSRDMDSVLAKEIVLKNYKKVDDWSVEGVIVYDTYAQTSDYTTYVESSTKKYKIFRPEWLLDGACNEVFICGVTLEKQLLKNIAGVSKQLFIFENDPFKINDIISCVRTQRYGKLCSTKSIKSYQAFTLFYDPIGNLRESVNEAVKFLRDYSDAICHVIPDDSRITIEANDTDIDIIAKKMEYQDKVKKLFETKNTTTKIDSAFLKNLVGENQAFTWTLESVEDNAAFVELMETYPIHWTNNTLVLNTKEIPTFKQVKTIVSDNRKFSKIVTIYKAEDNYWNVNVFTCPRKLEHSVSIHDALSTDYSNVPVRYYTKTGLQVMKVVRYGGDQKPVAIEWYNISGKRNIPVNAYVEYSGSNTEDTFVFFRGDSSNAAKYEAYSASKNYTTGYLLNDENKPVLYKRAPGSSNIQFDTVYEDNDDILFNQWSAVKAMKQKYLCVGNDYIVNISMTDRQLYECLRSKSI